MLGSRAWTFDLSNRMILGLGIDIIEVTRVQASCERFGARFLQRILHPSEIAYCHSHRTPAPFVAVRFAAKEAISKAFGTGIGAALSWLDMEVCRKESGEPYVVMYGKGKELMERRDARIVLITLSHTQNYAAAVAILERP